MHKYSKFEELLTNFPILFHNLKARGEWYITLYEIQPDTTIYFKRDGSCFPYPKRGKKVMYISYMDGTPDEVYLYSSKVVFYNYCYINYTKPPMAFTTYINLNIEYPNND
jgi:hypothetical protein